MKMRYTVYHVASTQEVKTYNRKHDAVARTNKMNAHTSSAPHEYAYASERAYKKLVVHMVERTNLISGKKFMPSNTPCYLSPSSETYWSS
jgi:hypothetical protein